MSEEVKKYIEAVEKSFIAAAKDFADKEEVKEFFKEQAVRYGKEWYSAETSSSPQEKKESEDNITAIVAQNKSEVRRLVLASDNVMRAKLEGVLDGVGNLILNLVKGEVGA